MKHITIGLLLLAVLGCAGCEGMRGNSVTVRTKYGQFSYGDGKQVLK